MPISKLLFFITLDHSFHFVLSQTSSARELSMLLKWQEPVSCPPRRGIAASDTAQLSSSPEQCGQINVVVTGRKRALLHFYLHIIQLHVPLIIVYFDCRDQKLVYL